jgi:ABC-2 type transport system ATP-binding protein
MSMERREPVIRAEHLERRYGRLRAVAGLSLAVNRGEVLALLGPNGAGKTTTLSMITGNLAPHAGRILIAGHDLAESPREAKRALGYLPETPPIYPELTVTEYLRFCARLHGLGRREARAAAAEACARCGLEDVAPRLAGHLSKGYQQRLGIAQAIVHRPEVIVLDEPTVGLDPVQIRSTLDLIRDLAAGAAVIVSTHLLNEAAAVASRVAIMAHGRIVHETTGETGAPRLRIECARAPARERLARIAGVTAVEETAPGAFLLTLSGEVDPRADLLAAAVAEDWGLAVMAPVHTTLEDTFLEALSTRPGEAA